MPLDTNEGTTTVSDDRRVTTWRKSTRSMTNGNCIEVARLYGRTVGVRDSRRPHGDILRFTVAQWRVFLDGIRGTAD